MATVASGSFTIPRDGGSCRTREFKSRMDLASVAWSLQVDKCHTKYVEAKWGEAMRSLTLGLVVCALMVIGAPPAHAFGGSCKSIPGWCPSGDDQHKNSVPEPGTLGLLALGTAASVGMLRRKKK